MFLKQNSQLSEKSQKGEAAARPIVHNGTVYTAWGTKIRGMNITVPNITETGEPGMVPKAEDLAQAPLNGMNCIKLAIHGPDVDPDWLSGGSLYENNIMYADWFVDTAEELGLYAIICLQTAGDPFQPEFVYDFWKFFVAQ